MTDLVRGGNAAVPGDRLVLAFGWNVPTGRAVEADISAYPLTAAGRVRSDADMIFYNQPSGAGGAVRFDAGIGARGGFAIDLARVPAEIERIALCVTVHDAAVRGQTLAMLSAAVVSAASAATPGTPALTFRPELSGATESAMTFAELYRRQGAWKFRAVGQGYNGGLPALARSFGIDVAEESARPAPTPPAPPPPPPAPPVSLKKVSLEKAGQSVSLAKKGADFGEIVVNLNWSAGSKGIFGAKTAIDLDLGCLFELTNGRTHVVQALGDAFGSYDREPYIELSGDDRTGDVSAGETIRINGAHWPKIKRIMLFANIYDGVPNWQATDGVVTVTMPDQPPIEVRMTEGRNAKRLCGVAMIENDRGALKATRIVEYFADQQALDKRFGFGLRWTAGRKD
ncbi:TerD family protein [Sphingomonas prati]|uniref:Tellurite resistance protein TerA n=1 Tax=Sphingomonas prati TaxID=1843237 RepID=A0A7W9BV58_9SPHN|nr:TerD family protein [Sphingomonas prati]MBB5730253.1 tellurite resistance protein TerA [Sphingomonas prati]GGE92703.1 tellurium resistance protein TerA [Sphingomonas prati]